MDKVPHSRAMGLEEAKDQSRTSPSRAPPCHWQIQSYFLLSKLDTIYRFFFLISLPFLQLPEHS